MTFSLSILSSRSLRGRVFARLARVRVGDNAFNIPVIHDRMFSRHYFGTGTTSIIWTLGCTPRINAKIFSFPSGRRHFTSNSTLEEEVEAKLRTLISSERVLLLLKGTPDSPQCGFSAAVVSILDKYRVSDYAYVDVLSHDLLRPCAKKVANWPTFPQLFVNGRLIGGCDVIQDLHESGSLGNILHGDGHDV
ncbi:Glutaredoxin-related protein [Babesia sp. Xinjiang]|uniref:Glutaredoxin-related protein n=1 Tax=Babesia sp. Xinjiang TaxID=462227 RepID=UPI000A24421F|nr:Glutaredoxin-related protein [Babesia sp. Xinjiang]ORM40801.1 Glutaredoxin-related protein [Babesia sp. Xinjiang]